MSERDERDDDTDEFTPDQLASALPPPRPAAPTPPQATYGQPPVYVPPPAGHRPPTQGYWQPPVYQQPAGYQQQPGYQQPPAGYGPPPGYYQQRPGYPPPGYNQPAYAGYPPYPAYPPRRGMGTAFKAFLLLLLLIVLLFIGLVAAMLTGVIRLNDVTTLLGIGPGQIIVQNMADGPIAVEMRRIDEQGETVRFFEDDIAPADVRFYPDRTTGVWQLVFRNAEGNGLGSCNLTVAGNGEYTFIVLPQIVVVSRAGVAPQTGDEMVVQTSPLCRPQS